LAQNFNESPPRRRKYLNRREKFRFCCAGTGTGAVLWTPCNNGDAIGMIEQQNSP
jgi:hypothetical protein